jgi:hypothetical protein
MDGQQPIAPKPEPNKSRRYGHTFLGIIFLVAALAAVTSYIFYWQTVRQIPSTTQLPVHKDATAGWKIYKNDQYGFGFKYLANFDLQEKYNSEYARPLSVDLFQDGKELFYVAVNPSAHGICLPEDNCSTEYLMIDTEKATHTSRNDPNVTEWYLFQHKDAQFEINFSNDSQKIFHQILSTFKFIDNKNIFCGGVAGIPCPISGYTCTAEGNYPDAGTNCVKND